MKMVKVYRESGLVNYVLFSLGRGGQVHYELEKSLGVQYPAYVYLKDFFLALRNAANFSKNMAAVYTKRGSPLPSDHLAFASVVLAGHLPEDVPTIYQDESILITKGIPASLLVDELYLLKENMEAVNPDNISPKELLGLFMKVDPLDLLSSDLTDAFLRQKEEVKV